MAGFDLCQCVNSHTASMNRLLQMLRGLQNACTDRNCVEGAEGPQGDNTALWFLGLLWVAFLLILFFSRGSGQAAQADCGPSASAAEDDSQQQPPPSAST
eukprot:m.355232 g.355232  ORF g.355232 m.355232 type:complete len:100 (-) comp17202_c0_seq1:511-810(-)